MGDLYLLDTNMVTYFISGRSPAVRRTYRECEAQNRIAVSTITQGEILFGVEKQSEATRLRSLFEEFFVTVLVVPWDSAVARVYGSFRAQLNRSGKSLSMMDMLIASHAASLGATLVTHDRAFVHAAPLLNIVDWATDL